MKKTYVITAAALLALTACARQQSAPVGMHDMPDGTKMMDHNMPDMHRMPDGGMMKDRDADVDGEKDGGMMGSMDHDDMTMGDMVDMLKGKSGDDLDAAFLEGMIPHHQGAIDMANFILKDAKHEELRQMARDIIDAQQREIDMMEAWQKEWGYIE